MRKFLLILLSIILAGLVGRAFWAWEQSQSSAESERIHTSIVAPQNITAEKTNIASSTTIIIQGKSE